MLALRHGSEWFCIFRIVSRRKALEKLPSFLLNADMAESEYFKKKMRIRLLSAQGWIMLHAFNKALPYIGGAISF
jgi:hypothetical protein